MGETLSADQEAERQNVGSPTGWEILEQFAAPTVHEKISAEITKAFNSPMTMDDLEEYEKAATTVNERRIQTGQYDAEAEAELREVLDRHSVITETPEEFRELLKQMTEKSNGQIDFVDLYYDHELAHNQKANELGFINHGFRAIILQDEDGSQSFIPAQATEPQPDWSLQEYYEKQLQILSAPGDDMSDGDKADYEDFSAKLQALTGKTR